MITGLSGSGKSSLAFDTIYAEGQRRYVESLSAYARQFLGSDGKARRRRDRRPFAGHLHRAEDHRAESPLHGRNGHRDLRLPAPALGPGGGAALPQRRESGHPAERRADRRHRARLAGGDPNRGAGAAGAGPEGRISGVARRRAQAAASSGCGSTARPTTSAALPSAEPAAESRHRRSWSTGWWCAASDRSPAQRFDRDGAEDGRRGGGGGRA